MHQFIRKWDVCGEEIDAAAPGDTGCGGADQHPAVPVRTSPAGWSRTAILQNQDRPCGGDEPQEQDPGYQRRMRNDRPLHGSENCRIGGAGQHTGRHVAIQHMNLLGVEVGG